MRTNEFIGIAMLLYALANPIGVIPIFPGLTHHLKDIKAPRIILIASIAVAGFLIVSIVLGRKVLAFFNVGLDDFRIAGGLLVLFIAFEMFQACYGGIMQPLDERTDAKSDIRHIASHHLPSLYW